MKKLFVAIFLLSHMFVANAYELNGDLSSNNDGSYSVDVENDNGHGYSGEASDNGDGTLDVNIEDGNGESYSGTATDNADGTYDLDLQNDSSGGLADGTLNEDGN